MQVNHFVEPSIIYQLRNKKDESHILWPNVLVTAKTKKYYKQVPESAFSIFSNVKGNAIINIEGQKKRICEETFMLVNPFQNFEYEIQEEVNSVNVHFEWDFFQQACNTLLYSDKKLLESQQLETHADLVINQLHFKDPVIKQVLTNYSKKDETDFFLNLIEALLQRDQILKKKLIKVSSKKQSTKKELLKRMLLAKDILFSSYDNANFNINQLSEAVAMSHFHFLRVFKEVFGITPGKMLKYVRMERTKFLLENTDMPINEIALQVGFEESNSLYPILKQQLKITPNRYREISNFQ
ncbi:helix-turn-helix transcriptional regulator [Chondrinema litorale]|uniref:helix-turn-helix transcriptional regulator n=1 Tax=Chondrinema litorale TaxID=2994555 RepID=UPI00254283E7|nr:AraC family transcriptional regulator [Chondrinema litorale]UZR96609.1 AraC family transcriptional regulator [Chondrinema litorale]